MSLPPPAEKSKLQVIHQNKSRWHTSTVRLYCFIFSSSTHLSFEAFPVSTSILGVFSIPRCLFLLGPSGNPVLQCSSTVKRLGHRQSLAVSSREGWVFLQAKKKTSSRIYEKFSHDLHHPKLNSSCPWKRMVGRLLSFSEGKFSWANC